MNAFIRKTSEEWSKDPKFLDTTVLDPDGWDRQDFEFSWFQEKITASEYEYRMINSTIMSKRKYAHD